MSRSIGLSLFLFFILLSSLGAQGEYQIDLQNRSWTPEGIQPEALQFEESEIYNGKAYRLVQFEEIPSTEVRSQLQDWGVDLVSYFPRKAYLASLPISISKADLERSGVRAVERLTPAMKMSRNVYKGEIGDWAIEGESVRIVALKYPHVSSAVVTQQLAKIGAKVTGIHDDYNMIMATIDLNSIYEVPALSYVRYVDVEGQPGEPEDTEGRSLHRSNMINVEYDGGLKYDGSGVAIQVRDDGVVGPHIDYKGRLDNLQTYGLVTTDHADMVSGIMTGAGNLNPRAEGMASGSDLFVTNYDRSFLDITLQLHQDRDVMVTNSSYSDGCNDGYTIRAQTVDKQINENPSLLHVFSAGNSGTLNCQYGAGQFWGNITGGHKIGKNVIATANLRFDVSLETSSSRGPAHDGRIKPDLAARGTAQLSTDPDNQYSPGGGTSAASPGVAGVSAQLYQAYKELNGGENPPSALIKAALMNTANDLGNVGPDFLYGFGHINAYRAYKLIEEERYLSDVLDNRNENLHSFVLPDNLEEVRFMLYWREPEAAIETDRALVNNFDLTVEYNGEEYLPYVLDPTPNRDSLNKPAAPGRDNLNNVEQVVFSKPSGGEYTVKVYGEEIPFGAREYFLLVETRTNEIDLTYPTGGEGFVPGETEQIHWDATPGTENFTLEYSVDEGQTWSNIGTASGNTRTYQWSVPTEITGQARVRVSRGTAEVTNERNFTIMPLVPGISINRVCPDYIEMSWSAVEGADAYDVFVLGEKFMEVVIEVDTNYAQVPVDDVLAENWFSVRPLNRDGAMGRRMNAISYSGGIDDCSINTDLAIVQVISPNPYLVYSCGEFNEPVSVLVRNNGETPISEVSIGYNLSNGQNDSESQSVNLAPGEETVVSMTTPLNMSTPASYTITVDVSTPGDELAGNSTEEIEFDLISGQSQAASLDFVEDFNSNPFPPDGWVLNRNVPIREMFRRTVIGADSRSTGVLAVENDQSREVFYKEEIYTQRIDLTSADRPALSFEYAAHINLPTSYEGELEIVIYTFCDERQVDQLAAISMPILKTSNAQAEFPWIPGDGDDWRKILFDLSPYAGNEIVVGFIVENDFAYNLYLDNINVEESSAEIPGADFDISNTTPCALFERVEVQSKEEDPDLDYQWVFGESANPKTAQGPGPHVVRFFEDGPADIELTVRDRNTGAFSNEVKLVTVVERPGVNFAFDVSNLTVQFTNQSSKATSYLWDFGDGNTSTEENPEHVYAQGGLYDVELVAFNLTCERRRSYDVEVGTVSSNDLQDSPLSIYPNPTSDLISIIGLETAVSWRLVDLSGKSLLQGTTGESSLSIDLTQLPEGAYFIHLEGESGEDSYRIVKMR